MYIFQPPLNHIWCHLKPPEGPQDAWGRLGVKTKVNNALLTFLENSFRYKLKWLLCCRTHVYFNSSTGDIQRFLKLVLSSQSLPSFDFC